MTTHVYFNFSIRLSAKELAAALNVNETRRDMFVAQLKQFNAARKSALAPLTVTTMSVDDVVLPTADELVAASISSSKRLASLARLARSRAATSTTASAPKAKPLTLRVMQVGGVPGFMSPALGASSSKQSSSKRSAAQTEAQTEAWKHAVSALCVVLSLFLLFVFQ